MMLTDGFLVPLLMAQNSVLNIDANFSAFSGLLTRAKFGSPGQELRVCLDFLGVSSILYHDSDFPPFVGASYRPAPSNSVRPGVQQWRHSNDASFQGFDTADHLQLGSLVVPHFAFMHAILVGLSTVAFREGAGVLGFAFGSPLMLGRTITLSEQAGAVHIRETSEWPSEAVLSGPVHARGWSFRASLQIGENVLSQVREFRFDPNAHNLVIPRAFKAEFIASLSRHVMVHVDERGQVMGPCDFEPPIDLRIAPGGAGRVQIPFSQFVYAEADNGWCRLRIEFADEGRRIVIGRQLLRSVKSVVLSNQFRRIGFMLLVPDLAVALAPFAATRPAVPTFSQPTHLVEGDSVTVILEARNDGRGLFLSGPVKRGVLKFLVLDEPSPFEEGETMFAHFFSVPTVEVSPMRKI